MIVSMSCRAATQPPPTVSEDGLVLVAPPPLAQPNDSVVVSPALSTSVTVNA
jgi:hypothetical protein